MIRRALSTGRELRSGEKTVDGLYACHVSSESTTDKLVHQFVRAVRLHAISRPFYTLMMQYPVFILRPSFRHPALQSPTAFLSYSDFLARYRVLPQASVPI